MKPDKPEISREIVKAVLAAHQIVTAEDIAEFKRTAAEWRADPSKMEDWALEASQIHVLVLNKLALNPPPGRSAAMTIVTAIKDCRDQVYTLVQLLQEARTGRKNKK